MNLSRYLGCFLDVLDKKNAFKIEFLSENTFDVDFSATTTAKI
jgi:hypothetical protein